MSLDVSRYDPVEREAVRRCIHAAHAAGAPELIRGLNNCIYGLFSELRIIDDDRVMLFLRYMLKNNAQRNELASGVLSVLRPPGHTPIVNLKHEESAVDLNRGLSGEIIARAANAAIAVRLNTYPLTSEGRRSGYLLCKYAADLRKGLLSPHDHAHGPNFIAAIQGRCKLPDGTDVRVQSA